MPRDTNIKSITLRIEEQLHEAADDKLHKLKTSFQAIITEFLQSWTFGEGKAPAAPVPAPSGKHREAHELLEFILENDRQAADWITGNLKMFAEAIRARKGNTGRPKAKAG